MYRGQQRKLLLHANRNGFYYLLDRATDVLDALTRGLGTELRSAIRGDPLGYERLDMS